MNKIVLASKSPRRSEILGKFVENLIIDSLEIDEKINLEFSPQVNVMSLSLEKASGISKVYPEDIVIGSDTIVYYDGNIFSTDYLEKGYIQLFERACFFTFHSIVL